jgi:hypothetical protein
MNAPRGTAGFSTPLGMNIVGASNYSDLRGPPRFLMRIGADLQALGSPAAQGRLVGLATRRALQSALARWWRRSAVPPQRHTRTL